jgi:hypothetical protein
MQDTNYLIHAPRAKDVERVEAHPELPACRLRLCVCMYVCVCVAIEVWKWSGVDDVGLVDHRQN